MLTENIKKIIRRINSEAASILKETHVAMGNRIIIDQELYDEFEKVDYLIENNILMGKYMFIIADGDHIRNKIFVYYDGELTHLMKDCNKAVRYFDYKKLLNNETRMELINGEWMEV